MPETELSIVMPCLNEESSLGACLEKAFGFLHQHAVAGEVIVADNGSLDRSCAIATEHGATVIHEPRRGYGYALMAGIRIARGKYIIMADADDSYHFGEIMPLLQALRERNDMVIGNRFKGGIEKGAMPWVHRYIGTPAQSWIAGRLFHFRAGDVNCGMRGFTKDCYHDLDMQTTGMEFISEMVVKASLLGKKITEKPVRLYKDKRNRAPHLKTFRDGWRNLRFFLLYSPRWLFFYPGITFMIIGIILSVFLYIGPIRIGKTRFDVHTLTYTSAAIILGFQLINVYIFSRLYAATHGLLPFQEEFLQTFNRYFKLEKGILLGIILLLAGIALNIRSVIYWERRDFGDLNPMIVLRWVIPSVTLILLGAQVLISCFFLSIMGIKNKNRYAEGE